MKNQYNQMKDYGSDMTSISRTATKHASARFTTDVTRSMEMNFIVPYGTYKGRLHSRLLHLHTALAVHRF